VGPVTIINITPNDPDFSDNLDIHGTTVNVQVNEQGWSNHQSRIASVYNRADNIARQLPHQVNPLSSIITLYSNAPNEAGFESGAILTVVDAPVAVNGFRPPYLGIELASQWRSWTESSLNYDTFLDLAITPNAPTPTNPAILDGVDHLLIDIRTGGGQGNTDMKITGSGGGADYGRGIAAATNNAVLALHTDYSDQDKRALMIATVQRGIDAYGGVLAGYQAAPDGGHNIGRKITMMAAAAALNDIDMLAKLDAQSFKNFQEDAYYIVVNEEHVNTPHFRGEADYLESMLNMPDWGDVNRANRSSPDWAYTGYRYINGSATLGFALAAALFDLRSEINNLAMFEYLESRYFEIMNGRPENTPWPRVPNDDATTLPSIGTTNGINRGVFEMWNAYYPGAGSVGSLELNPNAITFGMNGGDASIDVTTNDLWSAQTELNWLSVTPSAGDGNSTVMVSAMMSQQIGDRNGEVTFESKGLTRTLAATQLGLPDNEPPSIPGNVQADNITHNSISLSWTLSTDNSNHVTEYVIYQDSAEIERVIDPIRDIVITELMPQQNYLFSVSSVDLAGNESARSNEIPVTTAMTPAGPQPVNYWRLDESIGFIAKDSAGHRNGTLQNMDGQQWVAGILGNAIALDGVDDAITLGNLDIDSANITITAWVKVSNSPMNPEGRIISNEHFWMLSTIEQNNELVLRFRLKVDGITYNLIAGDSVIMTDEWVFVTATYDNNEIRLYKNAMQVGHLLIDGSGSISANNNIPAALGNQPQGDRAFAGLLDEICIFEQSLTPFQIAGLFNNGLGRSCRTNEEFLFSDGFE